MPKLNEFPVEKKNLFYWMIKCSYNGSLKDFQYLVIKGKKKYEDQHFQNIFAALINLATF